MIIQSVKDILGAELAGQVEEALKGKGKDGADIDLVVGNDGSFIPKETHELEVQKGGQADTALQKVASLLKELGASGDTKNLSADILKVKSDFDQLQNTHKAEMETLQKTTAVKLGLGATVHDPDDIISRLDLEKLELDADGKLKGSLDDLIKPIKESKPYLFKSTETQLEGAVPGQAGGADSDNLDMAAVDAVFGLDGGK